MAAMHRKCSAWASSAEVEREGDSGIKKPRLSLSLEKASRVGSSEGSELWAAMNTTNTKPHITSNALQNRFAFPVSENQLKKADIGVVPANTRSNLQMAERNFIE